MVLQVLLDPIQRIEHIKKELQWDGLSGIVEDPNAAYCPLSITATPDKLKPVVRGRQEALMKLLGRVGITAYDPGTAPLSSDIYLTLAPDLVYRVDTSKIASSKFFTGHNLMASSGFGVEQEVAKRLIRVPVILMDKNIRISRMMPNRTIYLQYEDFEEQAGELGEVFRMLKQFEPGIGFNDGVPVLLGWGYGSRQPVDLEEEVYSAFPDLKFKYDGGKDILQMRTLNPEACYENGK